MNMPPQWGRSQRPQVVAKAIQEEQNRRIRMSAYLTLSQIVNDLEASEMAEEAAAMRSVMDLIMKNLTT